MTGAHRKEQPAVDPDPIETWLRSLRSGDWASAFMEATTEHPLARTVYTVPNSRISDPPTRRERLRDWFDYRRTVWGIRIGSWIAGYRLD